MSKKVYTPTHTLEIGETQIDFYERYGRYQHCYIKRDTGEFILSVTGATGILDKPALIPWACKEMAGYLVDVLEQNGSLNVGDLEKGKYAWRNKRDKSADKGTIVHDLISKYIENELGIEQELNIPEDDDQILNAFLGFKDWVKMNGVKFKATEQLCYSKTYNFVGTLDCLAEIDGELCLIDFKTSSGIYDEMVYQLAGYVIAYEEMTGEKIDRCYIVRFDKKTAQFEARPFNVDQSIQKGFLSCLYLKKQSKELKQLTK